MAEASDFLSSQILLALDGYDVNLSELISFLPDPSKLSPAEKAAWIELRFWEDEAVLRSSSQHFQNFSVSRLHRLIRNL